MIYLPRIINLINEVMKNKMWVLMALPLLFSCNRRSHVQFSNPYSITVDSENNIYVLDCTSVIRKIQKTNVNTMFGRHGYLPENEIIQIISIDVNTIIAIHRTFIESISQDGKTKLIAGDKKFRGFSEATGGEARFGWIGEAVVTSYHSIIIIDYDNKAIREIMLDGSNKIICKNRITLNNGTSIEIKPELLAINQKTNDLYFDDGSINAIIKLDRKSGVFYLIASHPKTYDGYSADGIVKPYKMLVASDDNLVLGGNGVLIKLSLSGVQQLCGRQGELDFRNGDPKTTRLNGFIDFCVYNKNELLLLDSHAIRKMDQAGNTTTLIGKPGSPGCWE